MGADDQQERLPSCQDHLGCYIAGFVDGEGSFSVSLKPHPNMRLGWVVDPVFQVYQHKDRVGILKLIQSYLGCGKIKPKSPTSNTMVYIVGNRRTLLEKIIPFFEKYKLISSKYEDYLKFKEILERMKEKEHLTLEGLKGIVSIACSMNSNGKQRKYSEQLVLDSLAESSETIRRTSQIEMKI